MIDEKNTKFSSFSGQNNESFLKQKNQSRQEKVEQILEKKKELNVSKSKNKNLHNIDVQAQKIEILSNKETKWQKKIIKKKIIKRVQ